MAEWPNLLHPGVPLRWAWVKLDENPDWVAIHAKRTFEEKRIPPKKEREYPMGVIVVRDGSGDTFLASSTFVDKKEIIVDAFSVRVYPQGKATVFDFADSYNALWKSLCERFTLDQVFDASGKKIGEVWETSYLRDIDMCVPDGDFDVYHHGISVRIKYR